jgi:hypothetical protein
MVNKHKLDTSRPRSGAAASSDSAKPLATTPREPRPEVSVALSSARNIGRILPVSEEHEDIAATLRPTEPQRRYLERGLPEPGGKLPLFDRDGREVALRTIQACVAHGWAAPWFNNPLKPDWLVCRLTPKGYAVLGRPLPDASPPGDAKA